MLVEQSDEQAFDDAGPSGGIGPPAHAVEPEDDRVPRVAVTVAQPGQQVRDGAVTMLGQPGDRVVAPAEPSVEISDQLVKLLVVQFGGTPAASATLATGVTRCSSSRARRASKAGRSLTRTM
ncbi:hypothetical protein [Dactylosporangium fulvum]|uniref:Uncharacterized protein n=1 Tax=Dactylosporangium fulvum TaxID=53359 RepID=A0ABY5W272_9ACTN|nr:hypothetical protein [Dactylosporangium fulvum]UWP83144.1 hypothetical protein Dfulv_02210 [Dactylosporangium fulvum]